MAPFNPINIPLTFEAKAAGTTVTFNSVDAPTISPLEISINGGEWTTYRVNTPITLDSVGDKVMFRGTNAQYATSPSNYHNFSIIDSCYVYGNIMSLIDATNYATTTSLGNSVDNQFALACLFQGCTGLYTHTVKALALPATELTEYCYSQMFSGCTHLTVAPELPTGEDDNGVLQEGCYQGMFEGCTSLTASPDLYAVTLVQGCYASMFSGCSNLSHVTCYAEYGINYLNSTSSWLSGVPQSQTCTFVNSANFEGDGAWPRGENGIPLNWGVEH